MPTTQENHRLENTSSSLSRVAQMSQRLRDQMSEALSAYQRDKSLINSRLTDSNLSETDYLHNGASSPTIGEAKQSLRAVISYAVHAGDLTQSEAETMMQDAGIADTTVIGTKRIAADLEPLRV